MLAPEELDYLVEKFRLQGLTPEEIDKRINNLIKKEGVKRKRDRRATRRKG